LETGATTSAGQLAGSASEVGSPSWLSAHNLSPDATQRLATLALRLKAVADVTRLRILEVLVQQPTALCVCEITDQFALQQPTISHHLRLLREAGLLVCERRGTWSYYRATDEGKRVLASVESLA